VEFILGGLGLFFFCFFPVLVLALVIGALVRLAQTQLDPIAKVLWAILIVFVPILGSIAFFLVVPGRSSRYPFERR
jgi:hypothetical protein